MSEPSPAVIVIPTEIKTLREALDLIEDVILACPLGMNRTGASNIRGQVIDVLTALRSCDRYQWPMLKENGTNHIRWAAFPRLCAIGSVGSGSRWSLDRRPLITSADLDKEELRPDAITAGRHFHDHLRNALTALGRYP